MTYQELVDAAKAYADRQDLEVNASIDVFITMAESRINRVLKIAKQSHRLYTRTVTGQEFYSLPPDYNGMRAIHFNSGAVDSVDSDTIPMYYVTPNMMVEMQKLPNAGGTGKEYYYTIVGEQLQVNPTLPGAGTIEMIHYRRMIHLSESAPTNWMSLDHPDIYLSGMLCEIESFVKNYDAATSWDGKMTRMIEEIQVDDQESRWAGDTLTMRTA